MSGDLRVLSKHLTARVGDLVSPRLLGLVITAKNPPRAGEDEHSPNQNEATRLGRYDNLQLRMKLVLRVNPLSLQA